MKEDEYKTRKEKLSNLRDDIQNAHENRKNSVLDFLTVQRNPLGYVIAILTFVLAMKEMIDLFDTDKMGFGLIRLQWGGKIEYLLLLTAAALFGLVVFKITTMFMRKTFYQTRISKRNVLSRIIFAGSRYEDETELSLPMTYRLWLNYVDYKTRLGGIGSWLVTLILLSLAVFVLGVLIFFLIQHIR